MVPAGVVRYEQKVRFDVLVKEHSVLEGKVRQEFLKEIIAVVVTHDYLKRCAYNIQYDFYFGLRRRVQR